MDLNPADILKDRIAFAELKKEIEAYARKALKQIRKQADGELLKICDLILTDSKIEYSTFNDAVEFIQQNGLKIEPSEVHFTWGKHSSFLYACYDALECMLSIPEDGLLERAEFYSDELYLQFWDESGDIRGEYPQSLRDSERIIDHLLTAWNCFYEGARATDAHTHSSPFHLFEKGALSLMKVLMIPRTRSGMATREKGMREKGEFILKAAKKIDPNKIVNVGALAEQLVDSVRDYEGRPIPKPTIIWYLKEFGWSTAT
ncbi:MAG: hypothetical protein GXY61_12400 [Lentisphaerae bacterium]|nr:hypothetical protein [Lentisphaerota bacterium]